ncbi:alpha/beta hydrolase [Rhodococcoides fascians]|uniref:alpha/beta hydrolase n=1 Tax=Rhodococcoides fascians TaxID=1828 RepID=UPI000AE70BA2|nr:alpha/beta hydrolase fold domain-containing protein [Rhodococcus fascians]
MTQQQRTELDGLLRHGPLDVGGDVAEQRVIFHDMISAVPLPSDVSTVEDELGGVPVVLVDTPGTDPSRAVLYLHGGAYALGSAADSVGLANDVSRRVGARVISVDYRLAPEHPFPAALDDALAVYRALLDQGTSSESIAVVGESAGGGLAISLLAALRAHDLPQPCCAAVFSPWVDLTVSGTAPPPKPTSTPRSPPRLCARVPATTSATTTWTHCSPVPSTPTSPVCHHC